MSTPPPISSNLSQTNKFQILARISWIAQLTGIALGIATGKVHDPLTSGLRKISFVLWFGGLLCSLVALCGISKYGIKGILGEAIAGLGVTGLFFGLVTIKVILFGAVQPSQDMTQAAQDGKDAFLDYSGWLGKAQVSGGLIVLATIDEDSQASVEWNAHMSRKVSMVNFGIYNSNGTNILSVDPYSLKIINTDGLKESSESMNEVFSSFANKGEFMTLFTGPISVAPGQQSTSRYGFFTSGTDFSNVVTMTALVNGKEVTISGQFLTPEQKKERFQRGLQSQNENKTFELTH